jgi:hypothetical protein
MAVGAPVSAPVTSATPSPAQVEEGVRALVEVFQHAKNPPHWPMYLRNIKQYVKNASPTFDERRYGFVNFLEAVRAAGRAGLFRLERNRQGILRIFAGSQFPRQLPVQEMPEEIAVEANVVEFPSVAEETPAVIEEAPPAAVIEEPPAEIQEIAVGEEQRVLPGKRRPRASTSAKKKPAAPKKTRKKGAGSDSDIPF